MIKQSWVITPFHGYWKLLGGKQFVDAEPDDEASALRMYI